MSTILQMRMPQDLKDRLEQSASRKGLSTSALIRMALIAYLNNETSPEWVREEAMGGRR